MLISIVVPVYNEEQSLPELFKRLADTLTPLAYQWEVWFVDDGSSDATVDVVRRLQADSAHVRLLELSRNFGHQAALTAGLDFANGDVVISMDGDGQHPPELIPELLALYEQGFELVLTQRETKQGSWFKHYTSKGFYWLIGLTSNTPILPNSSDFRLMSRQVVLSLRQTREYHRFLRGLVRWVGFRTTVLSYDPPPRIAGRTKYSLTKMLRLATDALFSFSTVPLKFAILLGLILLLLAIWQLADTLWIILQGNRDQLIPGWTSLMFAILGVGGVQLIMLGVIGQYIGMIFQQVKQRPLYILRHVPADLSDAPASEKANHDG